MPSPMSLAVTVEQAEAPQASSEPTGGLIPLGLKQPVLRFGEEPAAAAAASAPEHPVAMPGTAVRSLMPMARRILGMNRFAGVLKMQDHWIPGVSYFEFQHDRLITREDAGFNRGPLANLSTLDSDDAEGSLAHAALGADADGDGDGDGGDHAPRPPPSALRPSPRKRTNTSISMGELRQCAAKARAEAQTDLDTAAAAFAELSGQQQQQELAVGRRPMAKCCRWFHLPGMNSHALDELAVAFELEDSVLQACRTIVAKPSLSFHRKEGSAPHLSHLFVKGHYVLPQVPGRDGISDFHHEHLLLIYIRDLNVMITVDGNGRKSWESVYSMLQVECSKIRMVSHGSQVRKGLTRSTLPGHLSHLGGAMEGTRTVHDDADCPCSAAHQNSTAQRSAAQCSAVLELRRPVFYLSRCDHLQRTALLTPVSVAHCQPLYHTRPRTHM